MQTLKDLFALNEDAVVYFCFKKRRRADMQFVKMAKKAFVVESLFDEDRPVFQRQALFLFSFRSRTCISRSAVAVTTDSATSPARKLNGVHNGDRNGDLSGNCNEIHGKS